MPETKSQEDVGSSGKPISYKEDNENDPEFVEVDPTGRYGRYNEVLGKGAFKTVYRAFDEVDGIEVAWNQVKVQDVLQSPEDLERLYSEVHLLKTLKHKNIIKFYSSWVDAKTRNVNFITEIFTSGTLRQYRKKHKHVDMKAVKSWARQILRGLLYLHSHDPPIIHRDLKCDNIFVNGNQGEVKIGDLGLAAILRQAHAAHSVIGTPEFMAPELYEEEYNELVDIYSFGMCVLEMVTFEYPYSECTNAAQIYKKVTTGKKPAALEKVKDPEVRSFVDKCLAAASRRLPARELLMDPFLQCDGDREALEMFAPRRLRTCADDMEELCLSSEERYRSNERDRTSGLPSGLSDRGKMMKGALSPHKLGSFDGTGSKAEEESAESQDETLKLAKNSSFSSSRDEQCRRSRDFRVKGKRREDDTIFLRLRIGDHEGHFRNIHFPFDIEADTALSVASEMVAELDLSDQDVTTIAEMIDAEILNLVPDWKPGAAFDESIGIDGEMSPDQHMEESFTPQADEALIDKASLAESPLESASLSYRIYSQSPGHLQNLNLTSPSRIEATMHGRFEEVSYRSGASDHSFQSEEFPTFSSDSYDAQDDETLIGGFSCPGTPRSDGYRSHTEPSTSFPLASSVKHANGMEMQMAHGPIDEQNNMGANNTAGKNWVDLDLNSVREGLAPETSAANDEGNSLEYAETSEKLDDKVHIGVDDQMNKILVSCETLDVYENLEDSVAEELRTLTVHQERELRELQLKHELALLEVQKRCLNKQIIIPLRTSFESQDEANSLVEKEKPTFAQMTGGQLPQVEPEDTSLDASHENPSASLESGLPCSSPHTSVDMYEEKPVWEVPLNVSLVELSSGEQEDLSKQELFTTKYEEFGTASSVREIEGEIAAEERKTNMDSKTLEQCKLSRDISVPEKDSEQELASNVSEEEYHNTISCYVFPEAYSNETLDTNVHLQQIGSIVSEAVDTAVELCTAELGSNFVPLDLKEHLPSDSVQLISSELISQKATSDTDQKTMEDISAGTGFIPLMENVSYDSLNDSGMQSKRGSLLEYYKTGCSDRDKLFPMKSTLKSFEIPQNPVSNLKTTNVEDTEAIRLQQQKKDQLQKSIAELEAKTLRGLHSSQNKVFWK